MTIIAPGIQTPLSRPQAEGQAAQRPCAAPTSPLRAAVVGGRASAPDAAIARLRRFLESGERPARFVLPGSYLNILV